MNSKVIKESSLQIPEEIKKLHERLLFKKDRLNEKEEEINFLNIEIEELKNQLTEFYDFNSSAFLTIDKNYSIQAVNFQSSLLMNYERNELINKNFFNFVSTFQHNTLKKCIHDLIEKEVKQDCELELLVKGGTRKYIKIECLFTKDKLILLLLRDMTYVRQLESQQIQLNQSLETVTNLLQNVSDAIATLDKEFYFKIINPSFIKFFSRIFAIKIQTGMNFLTLISDLSEYKQQLITACYQALLGEETTILIENSSELDEASFCFEINFNPIYNHSFQKNEIILLIKDLTEFYLQKKLKMKEQAKLAHAIRLNTMEGMASALAHEINQPLTAIFLYSQTCLLQIKAHVEKNKLDPGPLVLLNKIISQAKHASEVMSRMKSFIYQDVHFPEKANINLLIQDTMIFLDYELTHSKLKINLILEEELPQLDIDRIQIMQIIINLIRNSIEAMQENINQVPELTIQTKNKDECIEIHFHDNGPGIIPEHKDKILHSYFTTKAQGTGLGLTICRNLIEAHGGKLYVQNHDGTGAWFICTLPKQPGAMKH
ncbi:PAS domain-containing sensor histidine kinase [Legionella resiliens]|uniref:histidine kinase n=1 Tax=Legionella resiliens TaxID=2905958 RepID=A0ABS8X3I9_9GAMM|nr:MULTISPECIES: ATP-binding protein [unclassified Legionella]MCE0722897.1 ATP-binding protein [Legionella sp. 9fVS26]MCE3532050.1 ATP-binding protein [Legionella sp. 8cVS16]